MAEHPQDWKGECYDERYFYTPEYLKNLFAYASEVDAEKKRKPVSLEDIVSQDQFLKMLKPTPDWLADLEGLKVDDSLFAYYSWYDEMGDHPGDHPYGDSACKYFSVLLEKEDIFPSSQGALVSDMLVIHEKDDYSLYQITSNLVEQPTNEMSFKHPERTILESCPFRNTWALTCSGDWRRLYEGDDGWGAIEDWADYPENQSTE